jgi:hypothetical protein
MTINKVKHLISKDPFLPAAIAMSRSLLQEALIETSTSLALFRPELA